MCTRVVPCIPPDCFRLARFRFSDPKIDGPRLSLGIVAAKNDTALLDEALHRRRNEAPAAVISFGVDWPERNEAIAALEKGLPPERQAFTGADNDLPLRINP